MENMLQEPNSSRKPGSLGRVLAEKISAVEGLVLTPEMKLLFDKFDREGTSSDDQRAAIRKLFAVPTG